MAPNLVETYYGPRHIALSAQVEAEVAAERKLERGPRLSAPEQAIAGFLRKHDATREQLHSEGDYWVLDRIIAAVSAQVLIASALPQLLRHFAWPKSMRWSASSFTWVRPLRRIVCLLDGAVVSFDLREGADDGNGLAAGNLTEGHRFHAPGVFPVASCADWRAKLAAHRVLVDVAERRRRIASALQAEASARGLIVVDDPGLLDEVVGLVEWPVPLLGRIDPTFMDLPPEVLQVSMRVNQRYFALRTESGTPAPWFGFVANIEADDGGAAIIAGNERVLRARFADARYFWDLDRETSLAARVPQLDQITFHAKLGSQGDRVRRLRQLARFIAPLVGAGPANAERAAELAKADLVTGMVGEFPELQGVMGRYYALHDGEPAEIANAIRDHYGPKGPGDAVPPGPVSITVALADKLDQLAGFFAIGEKPSGSGDPYALRRAALGFIRIVLDHGLRIPVRSLIEKAFMGLGKRWAARDIDDLFAFIIERLRVQLRLDGARHDVMAAVFQARPDDDLVRLIQRTDAVADLLGAPEGNDLLTAYRRAANILRIEERKDGPFRDGASYETMRQPEEIELLKARDRLSSSIRECLDAEDFSGAMAEMAQLRAPLDAFFDRVIVNAPEPELRRNRLCLLNSIRAVMNQVADFSHIEG